MSGPVDAADVDGRASRGFRPAPRTVGAVVAVGVIAAAFVYQRVAVPSGIVPFWGWRPTPIDYLLYVSLVLTGCYLVVPLARRPRTTRRYWRRLRERPSAVASLGYLLAFALVGTFGPGAVDRFDVGSAEGLRGGVPPGQPPPGFAVPMPGAVGGESQTVYCLGEVTGGADPVCHGTWRFPLGTTVAGGDVVDLLVEGARVALEVALVTAAVIVPIAVAVGTVAAYYGGWVDELLMRYVDVQLVVPALFVVIIAQETFAGRSLLVVVLAFGLFDWGATARIVRSEALQRMRSGYVRAAADAGSGGPRTIRRHLVPNVSSTVVTAVTNKMPTLVVVEAGIAYLGFSSPLSQSWGTTLSMGLSRAPLYWWTALFAGVLLVATVGALHLLGDALRDVLDPRTEVGG
ncbi:ABC transporter permease [Candidatus Halobonum tyrrellensis]|uniref:ABC transporter permease n=1 Tax=Candidatus Halobonum tyrrellensis TaxID=1431545 RepID=UPI0012691B35|nr:ABC transporter permease [Candidatus Halobonum tyrrellensis]